MADKANLVGNIESRRYLGGETTNNRFLHMRPLTFKRLP